MKKAIALLALLNVAVLAQNTFTDARDKQKYKTVVIGKQTWMAENLKYNAKGSKCGEGKNCSKYGKVYGWATAKKVCPAGWHLPSGKEWQDLVDFAGGGEVAGNKLKAKSGWSYDGNGTDDYGFSALPGGYLDDEERPNEVGAEGNWWEATGEESWSIGCCGVFRSESAVYMTYVRCVAEGEAKPKEKAPPEEPAEIPKEETFETKWEPVAAVVEEEKEEKPVAKPEAPEKAKEEEKKDNGKNIYGARIAYNRSTTLYDGNNSGQGHGIEVGAVANIPISNPFVFSTGASVVYRMPEKGEFNRDGVNEVRELTEFALSIPILIRYNIPIGGQKFYAEAGAQIDIPLKTELKTISNGAESYNECPWRNSYDLGVALGIGWHINENFVIDIRGIRGVSEFSKEQAGILLVQGSVGLGYLF